MLVLVVIAFVAIAVAVVVDVVVAVMLLSFVSIDAKCWFSLRFIEPLFVPFRLANEDNDDDEVISK